MQIPNASKPKWGGGGTGIHGRRKFRYNGVPEICWNGRDPVRCVYLLDIKRIERAVESISIAVLLK